MDKKTFTSPNRCEGEVLRGNDLYNDHIDLDIDIMTI